ncbi:MAG: hypothetical protein J6T59_07285 [Bacteroidales bacterium]|nr:hypothetical protein [Bacteroidales bacterium]
MKEKTTIEDLFAQYQPNMGDRNEYMTQLSKKLEAAEYAKRYREAQTRRYRRMMVAVFISGIVTGAIGIVLILLKPLWLLPSGIAIEPPASFPMLPKVLLILAICFVSWCVTGLVRKISEGSEATWRRA